MDANSQDTTEKLSAIAPKTEPATGKFFETFIPAAPKDYSKVEYVARQAAKHTATRAIHVVTPTLIETFRLGRMPVYFHMDDEVLCGLRPDAFRVRPAWVFQQMLKLLQDVTTSEWYQVIDSDTFIVKNISLEENGKPQFILGLNQPGSEYHMFNSRLLGYSKAYPWSFLSELTLYNKVLLRKMFSDLGVDRLGFFDLCRKIVNEGKHGVPAESEIYGAWVYHNYPDLYGFKRVRVALGGRYNCGLYTPAEIEAAINERTMSPDVDVFSMHSWEGKIA